jgi:hypothetical protein
LPQTCRVLIP